MTQWLRAAASRDTTEFIWLHFDLTDASAQAWMQSHLAWIVAVFTAASGWIAFRRRE